MRSSCDDAVQLPHADFRLGVANQRPGCCRHDDRRTRPSAIRASEYSFHRVKQRVYLCGMRVEGIFAMLQLRFTLGGVRGGQAGGVSHLNYQNVGFSLGLPGAPVSRRAEKPGIVLVKRRVFPAQLQ